MADFSEEEILLGIEYIDPLVDPFTPVADDFDKKKWYLWVVFFTTLVSFLASLYFVFKFQILGFFGHWKQWKAIVYDTKLKKKQL